MSRTVFRARLVFITLAVAVTSCARNNPESHLSSARAAALRATHQDSYRLGRIEPAVADAERELAVLRSLPEIDDIEVARCLHDLGVYESAAGRYGRADSLLQEALLLRRSELDLGDVRIAETMLARIPSLLFRSMNGEAAATGHEAFAMLRDRHGDDHEITAGAMYCLGIVDNARGRLDVRYYEQADSLLRRALEIQLRRLGPDHVDVAETMVALGQSELALGNLAAAERLQSQGLAILRKHLAPRNPRIADAIYEHGMTLRAMGDFSEAAREHEEELEIRSSQFERHYKLIRCRTVLALLHRNIGEYETAVSLSARNVEDHRALYGEDAGWLVLKTNLALCHIDAHNFAAAESLLAEADSGGARLEREGADINHLVTTILSRRVHLGLHSGRFHEAEGYALLVLERLRTRIPEASPWYVRNFEELGAARLGRGDLRGAEAGFGEAARCFELARVNAGSGTRTATFEKTPYESRAAVRLELERYEEAWEDLERARGRVLGDALLGDVVPFPLARVQATLSRTEAIVGWLDATILPGEVRSWAFVIRSDGSVQWERLPVRMSDDVRLAAERLAVFRNQVAAPGSAAFPGSGEDFQMEAARSIHQERFAPLAAHLEGIDALVLVPSGAMAALPIDALVDESGSFLGERYALTFAPSCAIHTWLAEKGRGEGEGPSRVSRGLLVGDPAFREGHLADWIPPAHPAAEMTAGYDITVLRSAVRGDPSAFGKLPRLPWSRAEVEGVARFLAEPTILMGTEASATNLRRLASTGELREYDVIHLATHALVDVDRPEVSALILAQVSPWTPEDLGGRDNGILTADEIRRDWKIEAELVTLSACETALGRQVFGEGTVGFAYPLFVAGSRSVLASLWPVNDEATALLMQQFYANWLEPGAGPRDPGSGGLAKARALQRAQRWLREWRDAAGRKPYAHPYYWSAFVLIG